MNQRTPWSLLPGCRWTKPPGPLLLGSSFADHFLRAPILSRLLRSRLDQWLGLRDLRGVELDVRAGIAFLAVERVDLNDMEALAVGVEEFLHPQYLVGHLIEAVGALEVVAEEDLPADIVLG